MNDTFLALGGLRGDKACHTLQAIPPTNVKTIHQTSLLHIESNLDRLRLFSPTHGQRSQQQTGQITLQSGLINKPKFFEATHFFFLFLFFFDLTYSRWTSSLPSCLCGHKGSSHLSPVHALQFFIAMQVQHSYNSSTNG